MSKLLQNGVDKVGAHRIARAKLDSNLVIVRDLCAVVDEAHTKDAAAALAHFFGHAVGVGQQAFLDFGEQRKKFFLVAAPAEMHLPDLAHIYHFGVETASFAPKLGCSRGRCHN